jgi:hypothetical protein
MKKNQDFLNKTKIWITLALAVITLSLISSSSHPFVGLKSAEAASSPAYKIEILGVVGTITCTSGPNSGNTYSDVMMNTENAPIVKKKSGPTTGTVRIDAGSGETMVASVTSGQSNGRTFTLAGSADDSFCSSGFSTPLTITGGCSPTKSPPKGNGTDTQVNVSGNSFSGLLGGQVQCTRV